MSLSPIEGDRLGVSHESPCYLEGSAGVPNWRSAQAGALKANSKWAEERAPWLRGTGLLGEQISSVQRLQVTAPKSLQQMVAHSKPVPKM